MLKINKTKWKEKFTEIQMRQRMYQQESYITLIINTEFYPTMVADQIISGAIQVKVDMKDIHSIHDFVGQKLEGDIGCVEISLNNDGFWENKTIDHFQISFMSQKGRELKFQLQAEDILLETTGTFTFLYTTDTANLKKQFSLEDFYEHAITQSIHDRVISKYFMKD